MLEKRAASKPGKKRRRKSSKKGSGSESPDMATAMAATGQVTKENNDMAKDLPNSSVNRSSVSSQPVISSPKITEYPMPFQVPFSATGPIWSMPNSDMASKIDFIMSKVQKLDAIATQQESIISRLNSIELKIANNSSKISETNAKIISIESGQVFVSEQYDSMKKEFDVNKQQLKQIQGQLKVVTDENKTLKSDNAVFQEDIIDLQCRSMRDNLVFVGIPEGQNQAFSQEGIAQAGDSMETCQAGTSSQTQMSYANAAAGEDCKAKVHEFCEKILKIPNARTRIYIDRAHRVGAYKPNRPRAIVVKFQDTESKMLVKGALKANNLKDSPYGVFEQYPQMVQERRRALIPVMVEARKAGKTAYLVRDKLYINHRLFEGPIPHFHQSVGNGGSG